jgi:hypothetical protein
LSKISENDEDMIYFDKMKGASFGAMEIALENR